MIGSSKSHFGRESPLLAVFVAHLLATFLWVPQTRALRRGKREEAFRNYAEAMNSFDRTRPKKPTWDLTV
jgi:hypothetical protein